MSLLGVIPGGDYMTLVTCTPYGVNTHRLLVRGTRVETIMDNTLHFTSEAMQIDTVLVAAVLMVPILLILLIYVFVGGGRSASRDRERINREAMARLTGETTKETTEKKPHRPEADAEDDEDERFLPEDAGTHRGHKKK